MLKTLKQKSKRLFYKHKVVTRVTSMLLVFTLLFTSLPLGGMVASAAEVDDENTIITVEKELTEYRTEYSKTYLMSNNTLESVISANPMHYKNDSGNWVDIDSTLVLEETEDGEVYKNKAGGYAVSFPATNENGSSVKIESGEHTIEIELVEGKKSHARKDTSNKNKAKKLTKEQRKLMTASELYAVDSNQNSALEYNEVYDNTNVRYDINPTSVKESVIITKAPNKKVSYSYNIKADGLVAQLNENDSISFYEKTDTKKQNAIFVMPAPLMYDANDIYCYDIETTLKQKKGVYVLTYKPDYNWLKAKDRAYPVVLDPTTYVANSTQDAYTYSADEYQARNIGSENQIKVGRSTWKDPAGDTFETFIRFDELPTLNEGFAVSSALLMLTTKAYHGTWQELEVGAHKITEDWTNKLNQPLPLITYLNQPAAESFPRAVAHITRGEVDTEVGFEISEIVNEWYEDPTTNYGVKLSLAEAPPTDADNVLFHSSRATSGIPYLSIISSPSVPVTNVEITQSKETLDCAVDGYSFDVEATVSPENASYKKVVWQVEDESVAYYYDGKIYARGNGETTVTAVSVDDNTVTDSFDLEVTNIPTITADALSIVNLPANNSLSLGTKCSVLAVAKDSNQQDIAISNENVAWISSDNDVATVNELGEITAKGVGTATITATFAGITSSFTLTVLPTVRFDIHSNYKYLLIDETVTFTGIVTPNTTEDLRTNCRVVAYSDTLTDYEGVEELQVVELTKLSDDNASANLCTEYQIKGLNAGKATLRLELVSNTNVYTEITIDVTQNSVLPRELYNNTLKQGDTWTFAANPYAHIEIGDSSILSLVSGTTVKAVNPGTTSVEFWLRDRAAFVHRTVIVEEDFQITITNKPFFYDSNGNKHADTLYVGQTYRDLGLQGNLKNITSVEVVSGDITVATAYYEMAKGRIVLQGISPGVAPITVYVNEQTLPAATFDLNVEEVPVDGFYIEPYKANGIEDNELYLHEKGILCVDVYPKDAQPTYSKVEWYVAKGDKDAVSFISTSRDFVNVYADAPGYVEIGAKINGKNAHYTFPLTVKGPKINITNRPKNNKMLIGDTFTLGWNYEPTYAKVTWASKYSNVASINATEDGVVTITAKSKGQTIISAVCKYNGGRLTKTFTLKVETPSVTICKQLDDILIGDSTKVYATTLPSNQDVTYSASPSGVLAINNNTIVAKAAGTAKITATMTYKGHTYTDDIDITVTSPSITIANIPEDNEIAYNTSFVLSASTNPKGLSINWTTDHSNIIDVSPTGSLTAKNTGTAIITANITYKNKVYSKQIPLTVKKSKIYFYYLDLPYEPKRAERALKEQELIADKYYGGKTEYVELVKMQNCSDFIEDWNNMGDDGYEIQYVIINCHSEPGMFISLPTSEGSIISSSTIKGNLGFKQMKGLILLACNSGHLDYFSYKRDNLASAFSKVLNGIPVMATDGINEWGIADNTEQYYNQSVYDADYDKGNPDYGAPPRFTNSGWLIYRSDSNSLTVYSTNQDEKIEKFNGEGLTKCFYTLDMFCEVKQWGSRTVIRRLS